MKVELQSTCPQHQLAPDTRATSEGRVKLQVFDMRKLCVRMTILSQQLPGSWECRHPGTDMSIGF